MANQEKQPRDLVDTTDCLEAVGVFRFWKNVLFVVALLCLIIMQVCFWATDLGFVTEGKEEPLQVEQVAAEAELVAEVTENIEDEAGIIEEAAREVTEDVNAVPVAAAETPPSLAITVKPVYVMWALRTVAFILILAAVLYCGTILCALDVSLVGRLGGINHIARALVISLFFLTLILPWQELLGWFLKGAIFTPGELMACAEQRSSASGLAAIGYYSRFVVYWVIVLLLLISAQLRTGRWTKATLRRLEVI